MTKTEEKLLVWVVAFDTAPGWEGGVCGYDWFYDQATAVKHFHEAITWDPESTMVVLSPFTFDLPLPGSGSRDEITDAVGDVERCSDVLWETWVMRYLPPPPPSPITTRLSELRADFDHVAKLDAGPKRNVRSLEVFKEAKKVANDEHATDTERAAAKAIMGDIQQVIFGLKEA